MADKKNETMNVPIDIIYNFLVDLKKKEINPVERALIIKNYMDTQNKSLRQLAIDLGMPHTTLKGWLDYSKLEGKYNELLNNGISKTEIHDMLRTSGTIKNKIIRTPLNDTLKESITALKPFIHRPNFNGDTSVLIAELRNVLNRIEIHHEQNNK